MNANDSIYNFFFLNLFQEIEFNIIIYYTILNTIHLCIVFLMYIVRFLKLVINERL